MPLMRAVTYLIAALFGFSLWSADIVDADLGWHLFGGAWIVKYWQVPQADPINSFNQRWTDYHWLAQICMYALYRSGGYLLVKLGFGLLLAYTFKVWVDIILRLQKRTDYLVCLAILTVSAQALSYVTSLRPQTILLLMLSLCLRRLLAPTSRGEFGFVFLLTVLSANMHVYWVFLPLLWLLFRGIVTGTESRSVRLVKLGLLIGAGLLSPYGYRNYEVLISYLNLDPFLKQSIVEFQSILTVKGEPLLILAALSLASLPWSHSRALSAHILLAITGILLPFLSVKFLLLSPLFLLPMLSHNLSSLLYKLSISRVGIVTTAALSLLLCSGVLIQIAQTLPSSSNQALLARLLNETALDVCTKLAPQLPTTNRARGHLRVLTHFNDGGWCRWGLYLAKPESDLRVTNDGRTQNADIEQVRTGFEFYALAESWQATLFDWNPDAIVSHRTSKITNILNNSRDWKLVVEGVEYSAWLRIENS